MIREAACLLRSESEEAEYGSIGTQIRLENENVSFIFILKSHAMNAGSAPMNFALKILTSGSPDFMAQKFV